MSESHSDPFSQAMHSSNTVLDSEGRSIQATGLSSAAQQVKQKPRFAEFMCSYAEVCTAYRHLLTTISPPASSQVYRFAVAVTKTVIPMQFWGSQHNFKLVTHSTARSALPRAHILTSFRRHQGLHRAAPVRIPDAAHPPAGLPHRRLRVARARARAGPRLRLGRAQAARAAAGLYLLVLRRLPAAAAQGPPPSLSLSFYVVL